MKCLIFLTLAMIPVFSEIVLADAVFDSSHYGVKDGELFVSKEMVSFVGGSSVKFCGDPTNWQLKDGFLYGNFFSCRADNGYVFPEGKKVVFYCQTDEGKYLPESIYSNLANKADAVDNGSGGYNFSVLPVMKPTTFNSTHYGIRDGRMFISAEMVIFVGGSWVSFAGEPTNWQLRRGILEGDFLYCPADKGYVFPEGKKVVFYCQTDEGKYLPGDVYDNLTNKADAVDNGSGGYNFSVLPVSSDDILAVENERPNSFQLFQNYPNPFNPVTSISFILPEPGNVTIDIYDITGRKVETIADGFRQAGSHCFSWNGEKFSSGLYFCTVRVGDFSRTIKMSFLK